MRVIGGAFSVDREGDGGRPLPDDATPRSSASPRTSAPGIFDREGNELAESDSTPMFMGAMPKIVKGVIRAARRRHPRGRRHPPQRPLPRARRTRPTSAIVVPIFFEGELVGFSRRLGAPARHRRRLPGPGDRPRRQLVRGQHLPRGQALREGRPAGRGLASTSWRTPHADAQPRRHRGDDRRLRARPSSALPRARSAATARRPCSAPPATGSTTPSGCCARRSPRCPDGVYETEVGWLDDDGKQPRHAAAGQGQGDHRGRRAHDRPDRLERRGADRLQLPVRGHDVSAMSFIARMIFLDEAAYPSSCPRTRGCSRPVKVIAPKGSIFNPNYPRALLRPLLPGAARRRPRAAGARAGRARRRSPPATRRTCTSSPTPASTPRSAGVLGLPRGRRGLVRRPARQATAWTRSTA